MKTNSGRKARTVLKRVDFEVNKIAEIPSLVSVVEKEYRVS